MVQSTFVGASYYSPTNVTATNGSSIVSGGQFPPFYVPLPPPAPGVPQYGDNLVNATLNLPSVTSFSLLQFLSRDWFLVFFAHYITWSRLGTVNINDTQFQTVSYDLGFQDTWEFEADSIYQINKQLSFLVEFDYQEDPTSNQQNTAGSNPGIPGGGRDAYNIGAGFGYNLTKELKLNVVCGHTFLGKHALNTPSTPISFGLLGNSDTSSNNLRVELDLNF